MKCEPEGRLIVSVIWTVGHSTRSIEEFGALLAANGIESLVDVRSFPGSRRCPHFGSERLRAWAATVGIEYTHMRDLGGFRKARRDSRNTTWRNVSFRGYADYMETLDFREGVYRLKDVASASRTCYFCSEAVPWQCHRSMISDHMLSEGWDVTHIMGVDATQPHTFTEPASIIDGRLSYHQPHGCCQGRFAFA